MRTLEVFFWIEDYEKVDSIPGLQKVYLYSSADCSNVTPDEWGKLVFDELIIKFYAKNSEV
jgi:hypothetical protein